jgi:hypothetical protein
MMIMMPLLGKVGLRKRYHMRVKKYYRPADVGESWRRRSASCLVLRKEERDE